MPSANIFQRTANKNDLKYLLNSSFPYFIILIYFNLGLINIMNNNDWHHHITIHILHPRDMSRSLAHVRPRPVTRHVVPASVTGPHHRAVLHVTYNDYTRATCRHTTRIPTWFPCAAAAAAAPLSGWLASQLVKLPSAAPSAQAKLPSVTKSWRPSQDTSEPMRPWRKMARINIYNPPSVLPSLTCTTLFSAADSTLARVPPSAMQLRSADSQSVAPENTW